MHARETIATIERIRRHSNRLQHIDLGVDESLAKLKPGQFVLVRRQDATWDPYLAETWIPVDLNGSTVTIECPASDAYKPGQTVTLLGPVGAPFPMRANLHNLLLLALDTEPTALVLLAGMAVSLQIEVTLVLSGSAQDYPLRLLPPEVEVLHGDLDGWPNQVTTIGWADQVIAVANPHYRDQLYPALLDRLHQLRADFPKRFVLGLFDQPMPCGVGTCQGCGITTRSGGDKLVCVNGPALDLEEISFS
jgi:hypothetical protein